MTTEHDIERLQNSTAAHLLTVEELEGMQTRLAECLAMVNREIAFRTGLYSKTPHRGLAEATVPVKSATPPDGCGWCPTA
jgi:hypothetical protein